MKQRTYTEGSIPKHVAHLSAVMIWGFLAMTLGQLIEIVYVGQLGTQAVAALTFMFPISMTLNAFTRGIGIGASSLVAQAMGASESERLRRIISHCYLIIVIMTVSVSIIGIWLASPILRLLGAAPDVLPLATQYAEIWFLGFPAMGLAMVSNGIIRSYGDASYPGYIMTIAPLIQVTLGPILIFGIGPVPALGLDGAAWSFVFGSSAQLVLAAYWYFIKAQLVPTSLHQLLDSTRQIMHVGLPAAATNLLQPVSLAISTYLLASFGTHVIAGFGVAGRIESVVGMVAIGISTSIIPVVGQNWGAGLFDRARLAIRTCYLACIAWGVSAATLMWFGAAFFVGLITSDAQAASVSEQYLHIVPLSIGFMGILTVANHGFNAIRRPTPALVLSIARLIAIYLPLAVIAAEIFGFIGIFWAIALANLIAGLAAAAWFRHLFDRLAMAR